MKKSIIVNDKKIIIVTGLSGAGRTTALKVFEDLGGKVEYFGKPYPKVYNQAASIKNKKVLCIGDNLNTDIKGANNQNFTSLLITNGIHRQEVENENFEKIMKKYNAKVDYTQSKLKW